MLKHFLCSLFFIISNLTIQAQEDTSSATFLACVEKYYGSSSLLVNGSLYYRENTSAFGSPYFEDGFHIGTVYINGLAYKEEKIKYNLTKDVLILEKQLNNGALNQIVLSEHTVDSFSINEHLFVSKPMLYADPQKKGYLEKPILNNTKFYFIQNKYFESISSGKYPNGRYLNSSTKVYYKEGTSIQEFNNQKEFLAYFDLPKKAFKNFIRQEKIKFKKVSKAQLIQLIKFMEDAN